MRRGYTVGIAAIVVVFASVAVYVATRPRGDSDRPTPHAGETKPPESGPTHAPAAGPPARPPMVFGREGLAGEVTEAVARVVPAGNVQVAVHPRDEARWICIVADGPTRYFELDRGLQRDDFPWLEEQGFQPIPSPVSRSTASVCRSYAKKAMGYDTARGDRILVLLCPHDSWPKLRPTWPPADTAGK